MQSLIVILGSGLLAGVFLMLYFVKHAPVGMQTEEGFVAVPKTPLHHTAQGRGRHIATVDVFHLT